MTNKGEGMDNVLYMATDSEPNCDEVELRAEARRMHWRTCGWYAFSLEVALAIGVVIGFFLRGCM